MGPAERDQRQVPSVALATSFPEHGGEERGWALPSWWGPPSPASFPPQGGHGAFSGWLVINAMSEEPGDLGRHLAPPPSSCAALATERGGGPTPCLQKTAEGTETRQQLLRGRARSPSLSPLAGPPRGQGPGLPAADTALTPGPLLLPPPRCPRTMALTVVESGHQTPTSSTPSCFLLARTPRQPEVPRGRVSPASLTSRPLSADQLRLQPLSLNRWVS